ncbi:reverse transcriptase [Phytophthora megakarya]|uniref:Reverse transcriptase n=1 Tax=Phytophthora megakarya TaxID=4795 RepID=A0A225V6T8_9STRA|nr:reverse transcriptase [Phytophthora megakarya]
MKYISITNIGDEALILHQDQRIAIWLAGDHVPRIPGFISIGSRRYMEWQNLALEATTDARSEDMEIEAPLEPAVERPEYKTSRTILQRPKTTSTMCRKIEAGQDQDVPDCLPSDNSLSDMSPSDKSSSEIRPLDLASVASEESDLSSIADEDSISHAVAVKEALEDLDQATPDVWATDSPLEETTSAVEAQEEEGASDLNLTWDSDQDYDECVYYHEGSDPYAEDVNGRMAVLPEVPVASEDVKIEVIQLCGSDSQTPEEIDRLHQRIWKFRHLLISKGNALPPGARGVVCDINVGGARPIALKCRKLRIQFREKLADLIKGLLSAKMINYSRSPWLPRSWSLINDLLEDLESTLWYCSLDMASEFWVVKMTDRARLISAFITPFGLFEWNRMPFGLKNAPQIYQCMIDNAQYGFTRISKSEDHGGTLDVFEDGESVDPGKPSVLGRRLYIDDILIPANNWDQLCDRVLEACDKWNLSISVVKRFWGMSTVEYLGHKVSHNGLETSPKDLSALTDLAFPGSLGVMQSFLRSLNYYSRFIEDYAIYASTAQAQIQQVLEAENVDPGSREDQVIDHQKTLDQEAQDLTGVDSRWIHAYRSFSVFKSNIATTPILRHFDPDPRATVVVYASDWAISGSLIQEYDKIYYPVIFASRTL